jgi:hypothetical protein
MRKRQEQKLFANFGVGEADAARKPRLFGSDHEPRVVSGELSIGQGKQRSKRLEGQSNQLERHVPHLS